MGRSAASRRGLRRNIPAVTITAAASPKSKSDVGPEYDLQQGVGTSKTALTRQNPRKGGLGKIISGRNPNRNIYRKQSIRESAAYRIGAGEPRRLAATKYSAPPGYGTRSFGSLGEVSPGRDVGSGALGSVVYNLSGVPLREVSGNSIIAIDSKGSFDPKASGGVYTVKGGNEVKNTVESPTVACEPRREAKMLRSGVSYGDGDIKLSLWVADSRSRGRTRTAGIKDDDSLERFEVVKASTLEKVSVKKDDFI